MAIIKKLYNSFQPATIGISAGTIRFLEHTHTHTHMDNHLFRSHTVGSSVRFASPFFVSFVAVAAASSFALPQCGHTFSWLALSCAIVSNVYGWPDASLPFGAVCIVHHLKRMLYSGAASRTVFTVGFHRFTHGRKWLSFDK